tara:strand:+ start:554 stop:934 length:381 start_codon:yes stop_codon:yes gene_type:complete
MIFFSAIVTPSVFVSLNNKGSSKFLRTIFPRMFLFGFTITFLTLILSVYSSSILNSVILIIIGLSFIINRNYLTPMINKFKDLELEGDMIAAKQFKLTHHLSVLLFILNFVLLLTILINNYLYSNL